jgi:hydrogenase nickel incorporation protein HypA/HybF
MPGMHEMSLTQGIIDEVGRRAQELKAKRVSKVTLSLGVYSGVWRESVEFCYPLLAEGTLLQGSILEIREIPWVIRCRHCQKDSSPAYFRLKCEHCQGQEVDIVSGREFNIDSMEIAGDQEGASNNV